MNRNKSGKWKKLIDKVHEYVGKIDTRYVDKTIQWGSNFTGHGAECWCSMMDYHRIKYEHSMCKTTWLQRAKNTNLSKKK